MTVKSILDEKGREVCTVTKDMKLSDAAALMSERRIGAVVVLAAGEKICGILSERDIVRAVVTAGADALGGTVANYMTGNVQRCSESHTVNQVMEIMTTGRFRHLPVEMDGRLVGIVSIGDVVKRRIMDVEREADEMKAYIAS